MQKRVVFALLLNCAFVLRAGAQQQIVDPDFKPVVEKPAYRRNGPVVAIDEAHANFHTASGQYKPFADLLANDGYTVKASKLKFEKGTFEGVDVLVIANALSANATRENPGMPGWAFDRAPAGGTRTQLVFSGENGLLGTHAILRGRDASEEIKLVRTFTGQSLTVPDGATVLLKMSATSGEAPTPEALIK